MSRVTLCIATLCLVASIAVAEPFTAEHLVRIDRVGAPVVSPDGNHIVYALRAVYLLVRARAKLVRTGNERR